MLRRTALALLALALAASALAVAPPTARASHGSPYCYAGESPEENWAAVECVVTHQTPCSSAAEACALLFPSCPLPPEENLRHVAGCVVLHGHPCSWSEEACALLFSSCPWPSESSGHVDAHCASPSLNPEALPVQPPSPWETIQEAPGTEPPAVPEAAPADAPSLPSAAAPGLPRVPSSSTDGPATPALSPAPTVPALSSDPDAGPATPSGASAGPSGRTEDPARAPPAEVPSEERRRPPAGAIGVVRIPLEWNAASLPSPSTGVTDSAQSPPTDLTIASNEPPVAGAKTPAHGWMPGPARALVLALAATSLALAIGALYHRVLVREALDQKTRRAIYEAIREEPGIRVGTLAARLRMSYPTIARHIRILLRFGLVEATADPQKRLFIPGAVPREDRHRHLALSTPLARAVVDHLRVEGTTDGPALRAALGIPRSTASAILSRLEGAGLVVKRREGRSVVVSLATPR